MTALTGQLWRQSLPGHVCSLAGKGYLSLPIYHCFSQHLIPGPFTSEMFFYLFIFFHFPSGESPCITRWWLLVGRHWSISWIDFYRVRIKSDVWSLSLITIRIIGWSEINGLPKGMGVLCEELTQFYDPSGHLYLQRGYFSERLSDDTKICPYIFLVSKLNNMYEKYILLNILQGNWLERYFEFYSKLYSISYSLTNIINWPWQERKQKISSCEHTIHHTSYSPSAILLTIIYFFVLWMHQG